MIAATLAASRAYAGPGYSRPCKRHPSAACTSSVSALLRSRQHLAPKDCVHASLIALALGFEPSKHIGVEPRRYLLLARLIEPSTLGGLPEIICQRRGITERKMRGVGKRYSVRLDHGGGRIIKTKNT